MQIGIYILLGLILLIQIGTLVFVFIVLSRVKNIRQENVVPMSGGQSMAHVPDAQPLSQPAGSVPSNHHHSKPKIPPNPQAAPATPKQSAPFPTSHPSPQIKSSGIVFCRKCGEEYDAVSAKCPNCGFSRK